MKRIYDFSGIIQGVGFRPCVCRLARSLNVGGWIQNRSGSVRAQFDAAPQAIDNLISQLRQTPPPLSRIDSISLISEEDSESNNSQFMILESSGGDKTRSVMIPPDVAMCPDCRDEILNPTDRRYAYPFTTCVNCGPRYTVITGMPYDRASTTMTEFPLCKACAAEYANPANRRFHAETTCCPECGPQLQLLTKNTSLNFVPHCEGNDALLETRRQIALGKIAGIKGIGGFLLAADPANEVTMRTLRARKQRPDKPFAVMARNIDVIRSAFELSPEEEQLITSPAAPIVILNVRNCPAFNLALVSPDTMTLGVMLPTSPLHLLLLEGCKDATPAFDFLVMTSGNKRSEPICITTGEATERLAGIADLILTHNRKIALRNDDSLCIVNSSGPQVWRRARGYSPSPVCIHKPLACNILAMGAELKNNVSIGYSGEVVISPHVGDLETPEAVDHMNIVAKALPLFLEKKIEAVAVDLNPDMHSTRAGKRIAKELGIPLVEIQHHHAHAMACLEENGADSGFALVFDGTGYGDDDTIWGAELFFVDDEDIRRLATYRPAPLPGADKAVRNPVRQLIGRIAMAGAELSEADKKTLKVTDEEAAVWNQQISAQLNCPVSSGAGRLFDAMAALLGCTPDRTTYEGQPAIRLEALALRHSGSAGIKIPFTAVERGGLLEIDWSEFFGNIDDISDIRRSAAEFAYSFHEAAAQSALKMLEYGLGRYKSLNVAVSGGVFMNRILHRKVIHNIKKTGLTPLYHSQVPPNDGCISFGQIVQANRVLKKG